MCVCVFISFTNPFKMVIADRNYKLSSASPTAIDNTF